MRFTVCHVINNIELSHRERRIGRSMRQPVGWRNAWNGSARSTGRTGSRKRWGSGRGLLLFTSSTRFVSFGSIFKTSFVLRPQPRKHVMNSQLPVQYYSFKMHLKHSHRLKAIFFLCWCTFNVGFACGNIFLRSCKAEQCYSSCLYFPCGVAGFESR